MKRHRDEDKTAGGGAHPNNKRPRLTTAIAAAQDLPAKVGLGEDGILAAVQTDDMSRLKVASSLVGAAVKGKSTPPAKELIPGDNINTCRPIGGRINDVDRTMATSRNSVLGLDRGGTGMGAGDASFNNGPTQMSSVATNVPNNAYSSLSGTGSEVHPISSFSCTAAVEFKNRRGSWDDDLKVRCAQGGEAGQFEAGRMSSKSSGSSSHHQSNRRACRPIQVYTSAREASQQQVTGRRHLPRAMSRVLDDSVLGVKSEGTSASGGSLLSGTTMMMSTDFLQDDIEHCRFIGTKNVALVNQSFVFVAAGGVATWLGLIAVVYHITPVESFVKLDSLERFVAALAGLLILGSLAGKVVPLVIARGARRALSSGVVMGAVAVQLIASITDLAMATLPTVPVMVDPFTRARVYPLRYCEWTVLAFMMTYFTEGMQVPVDDEEATHQRRQRSGGGSSSPFSLLKSRRSEWRWWWKIVRGPFLFGLSQGLSTLPGLIFPYCVNWSTWLVTMIVSCVLYLVLFPRWYHKRRSLLGMVRGSSVDEVELHDRVRLSYQLLTICVTVWTSLVSMYFVTSFAHWFVPADSLLAHKSLSFVGEAAIDVLAKALYMDVIVEAHGRIFDDQARSTRRLEELRRMISVVWETSSDVIAISVRGEDDKIVTMLSPSFHKLEGISDGNDGSEKVKNDAGGATDATIPAALRPVVFDMDGSNLDSSGDKANGSFAGSALQARALSASKSNISDTVVNVDAHSGLLSIQSLLMKAWTERGSADSGEGEDNDVLLTHNIHLKNGSSIKCEAKATRLGSNALVVVMRDISERFRRFEAEKRAVSETTAREKDAEANRFTRHEVKNGLLASIGLCDGLREKLAERQEHGETTDEGRVMIVPPPHLSSPDPHNKEDSVDVHRYLSDLDMTLKEVLDTVLSEAMVRDVVHEVYEPKHEHVDLESVLRGVHRNGVRRRFPLVSNPSPLPMFLLDPQLVKYIHRNAVSNACKYGKKGGVVLTEAHFDGTKNSLRVEVMNLPGEGHESLLRLGEQATKTVFAPGMRLHSNVNTDDVHVSHSSGDGAWISRKCAKTLGGGCDIHFEQDRTVFSFWCPATPYDVALRLSPGSLGDPSTFRLPENTWGVAIDDSKIQRKVLRRIFSVAGVPEERQVLLGKDASEIRGFNDYMAQLIGRHPTSYFLLLADENLDIVEDNNLCHTISGSLCVYNLRQQLEDKDEKRMLALVRSANDSASDVAIYNSRAHGFMCKAPIQRDRIMEILAPLWARRFANRFPQSRSPGEKADASAPPKFDSDANVSTAVELMQTLGVIDALCIHNGSVLSIRWSVIKQKLDSLKGDLSRLDRNSCVVESLEALGDLDVPVPPHDFLSQWADIRSKIIRVI